jgi:hypothetical protein
MHNGSVVSRRDFKEFLERIENGEAVHRPFCIVRRPVGRRRSELIWCQTREELGRQRQHATKRRPLVIAWSRLASTMSDAGSGIPVAPTMKPHSYGHLMQLQK